MIKKYRTIIIIIIFLMIIASCKVNSPLYNNTVITESLHTNYIETHTLSVNTTSIKTVEPTQTPVNNEILEIFYFNVGQGDAILINFPYNKKMLIDAGDNYHEKSLINEMKKMNITKIDWVIGTHPDGDHIGGMDGIIKNFKVDSIYIPLIESDSDSYKSMMSEIKKRNLNQKNPKVNELILDSDEIDVAIKAPEKIIPNSTNESSIVIQIDYNKTAFLFTGDANYSPKEFDESQITVLKVSHHGSKNSNTLQDIEKIDPEYSIISVGKGNKYKHPDKEVLNYLRAVESEVLRTDNDGSIKIQSDGKKIIVVKLPQVPAFIASATSPKATISFTPTKALNTPSPKPTITAVKNDYNFIGNINSRKFHKTDCSSIPDEENRIYFKTKEQAIEQNYEACKLCNP